jgi:hypothetical protein
MLGTRLSVYDGISRPDGLEGIQLSHLFLLRLVSRRSLGRKLLPSPQRIGRVFGRNLSILGTDGSHSTAAVFFYMSRLYEIEGTALGSDANADVVRFTQSLVFTDKANAAWPEVVERLRGECRRQCQNLRGADQTQTIREHVRDCVLEKVRVETGKNVSEPASQTPRTLASGPSAGVRILI